MQYQNTWREWPERGIAVPHSRTTPALVIEVERSASKNQFCALDVAEGAFA